jgi:hypothetical protein
MVLELIKKNATVSDVQEGEIGRSQGSEHIMCHLGRVKGLIPHRA